MRQQTPPRPPESYYRYWWYCRCAWMNDWAKTVENRREKTVTLRTAKAIFGLSRHLRGIFPLPFRFLPFTLHHPPGCCCFLYLLISIHPHSRPRALQQSKNNRMPAWWSVEWINNKRQQKYVESGKFIGNFLPHFLLLLLLFFKRKNNFLPYLSTSFFKSKKIRKNNLNQKQAENKEKFNEKLQGESNAI